MIEVRIEQMTVHFPLDMPAGELLARLEQIMSILERLQSLNESADRAIARVQADVSTLRHQISELKGRLASGQASPEETALLDTLQAKLDALDPVEDATLDDVPAPEGDGGTTAPAPDAGTGETTPPPPPVDTGDGESNANFPPAEGGP